MAEFFEAIGDMLQTASNITLFGPVYGCITMFIQCMMYACVGMVSLFTDGFNDLIANNAVQAYLTFLQVFASILFIAGIAMAISEWAINANEGNTDNIMGTFKYILLGLFVTTGFTTIPVLLMQFTAWCTNLMIINGCSSMGDLVDNLIDNCTNGATDIGGAILWYIFMIIFIVNIIKIFLSNIKRGGVLLVQLIACPFHIFSIPRGHVDAFYSWCKQVIALYITTFAQNFLMALGLMILGSSSGVTTANMCLCIGVLLAAAEAPQILQQFGLDSSVKASPTQAIYAASGVANIVGTFAKMA